MTTENLARPIKTSPTSEFDAAEPVYNLQTKYSELLTLIGADNHEEAVMLMTPKETEEKISAESMRRMARNVKDAWHCYDCHDDFSAFADLENHNCGRTIAQEVALNGFGGMVDKNNEKVIDKSIGLIAREMKENTTKMIDGKEYKIIKGYERYDAAVEIDWSGYEARLKAYEDVAIGGTLVMSAGLPNSAWEDPKAKPKSVYKEDNVKPFSPSDFFDAE